MKFCLLLLPVLFVLVPCCQGWSQTHRDVPYDDDHSAQCLDAYLVESAEPVPAMVYIHGGGWRAGSKRSVPAWLRNLVAEKACAVIAVEYRFTDVATHPAQVNDCMRAIQFVRKNASKWNINPQRIGVTGGSAGGHLSAYVALHDDIANKGSKDVVERQSSRVACAVSFAGPTDWTLLKTIEHKHPAYRQLIGYEPKTPPSDLAEKIVGDVSPITFASKDDPPIMQVHGDKDVVVPVEHASKLHKKLLGLGVTSKFVVIEGGSHSVAGAGHSSEAREFVTVHLLSNKE